jgi:hypothetical protein
MQDEFLGYTVEKIGNEPNKVGYLLHGKRVTYTLMRCVDRPHQMYALNSKYNICAIKGNHHFSDEGGEIKCVY